MASRIREMFYGKEDPVYRVNHSQQQLRGPESRSQHGISGRLPVLELRVPMCCEKCQEKVKEELEELEGVRSVICDQYNQRVTITGHVDPMRALKKVKRVKKKSEFFTAGSYIDHSSHRNLGQVNTREVKYTGHPLVRSNSFGRSSHDQGGLTRTNSFGRSLGRMPSFGKVTRYDGGRQHEFEPRDLQRDYYGVRRMPSFKKHRYHDAEYISMDNQYTPYRGETHYVSHHSQRPVYRSQVSFSKLPVTNPYYLKHIDSEY